VVAHGGSLSGEHGDGQARAELLPKMYGPDLRDVHLVRGRGFRGTVGAGAGMRRTGVRAVRRPPGAPAAPAEAAAPKAPSEPSTAGAVAAVTAVVIVLTLTLTLTGMVAQLFTEPQRDRTAGTE
ncbi:FAD-linked oxidase C-terminal domain-containing protein, partial [Streptomyces decoyicus]